MRGAFHVKNATRMGGSVPYGRTPSIREIRAGERYVPRRRNPIYEEDCLRAGDDRMLEMRSVPEKPYAGRMSLIIYSEEVPLPRLSPWLLS